MSRVSEVSRQTLTEGVKELDHPGAVAMEEGRSRKPDGARKHVWEERPGILDVFLDLLEAHTKGDTTRLSLWTNKSLRNLSEALAERGIPRTKTRWGSR